jgi:hypothetical protein
MDGKCRRAQRPWDRGKIKNIKKSGVKN